MTGPRVIPGPEDKPEPRAGEARPRVIQGDSTDPITVRPPPDADDPNTAPPLPRRRSPLGLALAGLALLIGGGLALDAVLFVQAAFALSTGLGIAAASVLGLGVAGPLVWLLWEWRSLSGLKTVDRLHDIAGAPAPSRTMALRVVEDSVRLLPRAPALEQDFRRRLQPHHDGADVLNLARATLMPPCDATARRAVQRAVAQTAALTALSPTVLTDTLLFVVRAVVMLRSVAQAYGQHPGIAGVRHLLRQIAREAATLGAIELGAHSLGEIGGAAGQRLGVVTGSMVAAQRMGRLGVLAMRVCRPIPFDSGEMPTLLQVAGDVLGREKD